MVTDVLIQIYERDLNKVKAEIALYKDETDLWKIDGDIANSAGNLVLHIIGNLKHFIGTVLGEIGYVRDRDREFSDSGIPREKLLSDLDETAAIISTTLKNVTDDDLSKIYPFQVFGHPMTTEFFLIHLATHLNWHFGQINYHRRLLAK